MRINQIYLDMDGVLCDFVGAALRVHKRMDALDAWPKGEWDIANVLGVKEHEFWARIDYHGEHFWADLQPYPWMNGLVKMLSCYSIPIMIASSPSYDPYSAAGKLLWLDRYLPQFRRRYFFGGAKHLLASPWAVLIDDNDKNVDEFRKSGGKAVLFPQPWNHGPDVKAEDKVSYVADCLIGILTGQE